MIVPTLKAIDLCTRSYLEWTVGEAEGCRCLVVDAATGGPLGAGPRAFVFMGTRPTSWRDWARDAAALKYRDPVAGNVHMALWLALCRVSWRVFALFRAGDVVLGHSAGGAYAHGFAAQVAFLGWLPGQLSTFEAARMGDELAHWLDPIPGDDWSDGSSEVTNLPFWGKPGRSRGYRHLGKPKQGDLFDPFILDWGKDHELDTIRANYIAAGCPE